MLTSPSASESKVQSPSLVLLSKQLLGEVGGSAGRLRPKLRMSRMHQNWPPSELSHPDPGATLAGRVSPHLGHETQEAKPDDHQDDDEAMKFLDLGLLQARLHKSGLFTVTLLSDYSWHDILII